MKSQLKKIFGLKDDITLPQAKIKKLQWEAMNQKAKFGMIFIVIVFEILFFYYIAKSYGMIDDSIKIGEKVAVIDFNKQVTQEYVNTIIRQMDKIKEDSDYMEVLFVMNSPGGSPSASEELSEYLKDYNAEKNVTMYIQSSAASGGYYIASSIKPLYTNKNAIVGSIGVIMPHYNIGRLAQKIGVEEDDLSAGKFKKPVSFFKKMGEEDKEYLKAQMLTPTYDNFVQAVAENRGIEPEKLKPYTEGKIYIGNNKDIQGVLVDEVIVLHKLKNKIRKKYANDIAFVDISTEKKNPFFGEKVEFDVSLDTNFGTALR